MRRPVQTVLIESIVIGLMNAGLFYMLKMLKIVVPTHILLIICGALISQFLKGGVEQGLERSVWLCGRLQWLRPAVASCLAQPAAMDEVGRAEREAVLEVWSFTREQMLAGQLDQLVLDELGLAVELGFLEEAEVVAALEQRPSHLDVILTGPSIPSALLAMADQVTQLRRGF